MLFFLEKDITSGRLRAIFALLSRCSRMRTEEVREEYDTRVLS
jgi:hypothetical protein